MLVLVLVLHRGAVSVSSTGSENQFQVDDNGNVGRPCEVSLAPPYPELFASYGASTVTRTSGRGHVAEAKTNVIEVSGFSIRVGPTPILGLNWSQTHIKLATIFRNQSFSNNLVWNW